MIQERRDEATGAGWAGWPWALAGVCLLAFALRLGAALGDPTIARPDELFQNIEPAFRMWSGHGTLTWEWRTGIRSPVFPGMLAGLMGAAAWAGGGAAWMLATVWVAMSALSTMVVALAFCAGGRRAGMAGALCCGVLCAVWPDLVYFGSKPLAEVQAGNLLAIASLLVVTGGKPRSGGAVLLAVGGCLGLAFCLRYQFAPAICCVGVWAGWGAPRRLRGWLIAGAVVPLSAMGIADWGTWGEPYRSVWGNFEVNALQDVSSEYGTHGVLWYGWDLVQRWGAAVVPVAACACAGVAEAPVLACVVLLVLLPHSLVGHKEASFVQAAVAPALVLAALGACRLFATGRGRATAGLLAFWIATAVATGCGGGFLPLWRSDRAALQAIAVVRRLPGLCGVGLRRPVLWYWTASDALLGRAIPFYAFGSAAGARRVLPAINAVLGGRDVADGLAGFAVVRCWPDPRGAICLAEAARRSCVAAPGFDLDAVTDLGRPRADVENGQGSALDPPEPRTANPR